MKNLILLLLVFFSCENKDLVAKNIHLYNYQDNKTKNIYYLNYNFNFPYEILVNDVLLEKDVFNGRSEPDRLNNYILNKGKQKIKIKVFAPHNYNNGLLTNKDLKILDEQSAIYKVDANTKSYNLIKKLPFNSIVKDIPYYEQKWEFDADTSSNVVGWKNSKDLTKIDKQELIQKVQKKYSELYNQLNEGNINNFLDEIKYANNEFFSTNYFDKSQENEYLNNLKNSYSNFKNKMIPFNNGYIRIMGNGKTITLEIPDGKYKGMGVLIAEDKDKKNVYYNTVILHIPQNTDELKIVRINSIGGKL